MLGMCDMIITLSAHVVLAQRQGCFLRKTRHETRPNIPSGPFKLAKMEGKGYIGYISHDFCLRITLIVNCLLHNP